MSVERVTRDLWKAAQDEALKDFVLVGNDGQEVCCNRFVLAARSPVFRTMLYGSFREAKTGSVPLPYPGSIVKAVTDFCVFHSIKSFTATLTPTEELAARLLVQLSKAADFLSLPDLASMVDALVRTMTVEHPPLACAVYDEATVDSDLANFARTVVQVRPYVSLPDGIDALSEERIVDLYKDQAVAAGEGFLFDLLLRWVGDEESRFQTALQCVEQLRLEHVAPEMLLSESIQSCSFVSSKLIFDAVGQQALRSSKELVWSSYCRGVDGGVDRVLVEGAGTSDANGIYYRIEGLSSGELYTKQEVSCGQQNVYSLSCREADGHIECRIFCNQLLTYGAVLQIQSIISAGVPLEPSTFQPVLQLHSAPIKTDNQYRVMLSDGDYFMPALLPVGNEDLSKGSALQRTSVIKVISFAIFPGSACVHIRKWSLVSDSTFQRFGNPVSIDVLSSFSNKNKFISGYAEVSSGNHQNGICHLYSCKYPISERTAHFNIPPTGWQNGPDGIEPVPRCDWISSLAVTSSM